ncbi:MAG: helicase-associated domain-containing protein, partial [Actinomycetes bacterium]
MPATLTPLAEWLRGMDDDTLIALLRTRPDLAIPAPADSKVLATRAGLPASVIRACEDLDRFTLAVLTALVVAAADHTPVSRPALVRLLGPGVAARQVSTALDALRRRALAWGGDDALVVVPAAREVTGPHPGGLGRPAPELDGVDLEALLAQLPPPERKVLHTLAEGPPVGATREAAQILPLNRARTPVARLLARGLLRRIDSGTVELPAQVGIALRGDCPLGRLEPAEPKLSGRPVDQSVVDSTAAGAVLDLLRRVENLFSEWSREPPAVLRSGGLGVRDARRTARVLAVEEPTAVLLAEVGVAAGLLTHTEDQLWLPTVAADSWLAAPTERRWSVLADAWLTLPRLPGLAGARDDKGRPLASLSEELRRPRAAAQRRWTLEALAELPGGKAITRADELATVLAWRAPRRGGRLRDAVVGWTVEEATALGMVALGAVSTAGRVLLHEGPLPAAVALRATLPEPVDHVLVQADRTVVAPGPLEPELARQIGLVADVESAGGATVYRVTEATVRRALDAGHSAADLHELFRTRSRTSIPQSLSYLIDDVARRHGRLRGGSAASFLRCDDEALLAELLAHPVATRCALRRLAVTVVISPVPLIELLDELRSAGFSPTAENADGQIVDLRAGVRRAPVRTRPTQHPTPPRVLST